MSHMHKLTCEVNTTVRDRRPSHFAIVFDGWSENDTSYVIVHATFLSSKDCGIDQVLLGCSSMEYEETLNANEHYGFL